MSWDVIIFNSPDKVDDLDEINTDELEPIDFGQVFEKYFKQVKKDGNHCEVSGDDFTINFFVDDAPSTNFMVSLYGENAIYAIAHLAKTNSWQVFDTGLGEMLDIDDPSNNGYDDFQDYLKTVLRK